MSSLKNIVKLTQAQYEKLSSGQTITKDGITYSLDQNDLYFVDIGNGEWSELGYLQAVCTSIESSWDLSTTATTIVVSESIRTTEPDSNLTPFTPGKTYAFIVRSPVNSSTTYQPYFMGPFYLTIPTIPSASNPGGVSTIKTSLMYMSSCSFIMYNNSSYGFAPYVFTTPGCIVCRIDGSSSGGFYNYKVKFKLWSSGNIGNQPGYKVWYKVVDAAPRVSYSAA